MSSLNIVICKKRIYVPIVSLLSSLMAGILKKDLLKKKFGTKSYPKLACHLYMFQEKIIEDNSQTMAIAFTNLVML